MFIGKILVCHILNMWDMHLVISDESEVHVLRVSCKNRVVGTLHALLPFLDIFLPYWGSDECLKYHFCAFPFMGETVPGEEAFCPHPFWSSLMTHWEYKDVLCMSCGLGLWWFVDCSFWFTLICCIFGGVYSYSSGRLPILYKRSAVHIEFLHPDKRELILIPDSLQ